ncbi:MAG: phosphodiester glycosidase family protein [Flavobacteriales bacterium]|nr:phosphodiester glycosidase family protein [Flavobacteriales bacterium]
MKWFNLLIVFLLSVSGFCQVDPPLPDYSEWTVLIKGMEYREVKAPLKSVVGDSKLSILRIDPKYFDFGIHAATAYDRKPRTLHDWADTFRLNVVFNAGMYDLSKPLMSKGYLGTKDHINNGVLREYYRSMIAVGSNDTSKHQNIEILDLGCESFLSRKNDFQGYAQGLRMINCDGVAMAWNKRNQSCSMMVAAQDSKGWFYLIFCRSPYTHNQMIRFMKEMPYGLTNAIYLEGGPETSLLIDVNGHCIEKVGSYVSSTYERDDNNNFWKLPNVIGVRVKKN